MCMGAHLRFIDSFPHSTLVAREGLTADDARTFANYHQLVGCHTASDLLPLPARPADFQIGRNPLRAKAKMETP